MKTVRFSQLVEASGAPTPYLLWSPPQRDPTFQTALKQNRILAVHQQIRGGKKDYAAVGFSEDPDVQFFEFPRSLARFRDRRVIGLDYSLLAKTEPPRKPAKPAAAKSKSKKPPKKPPPPKPPPSKPSPKPPSAPEVEVEPEVQAAEVVEFPSKKAPAPKHASARPDPLPDLRRAIKELKAGKAVAAYDRLRALVDRLEQA